MKANYAPINPDLSYWQKQTQPLFADLLWNIPEQKTGNVNVIGGNANSFSTPVRVAETLERLFPLKHIHTILPDALKNKFPPLLNLSFMPSTASGSFARSRELEVALKQADANLIIGDLSKNSETAIALAEALKLKAKMTTVGNMPEVKAPLNVITRDAIDLLAPEAETLLMSANNIFIASMVQVQKILRAVYYPKMILLSQPLIPIIETLHKFTLSYPTTLLTFHQDNIIVAKAGQIITTHIVETNYSPISLWSGTLAAKVTALNLYNPHKTLEATTAAILQR